jgi:hypothetical protein
MNVDVSASRPVQEVRFETKYPDEILTEVPVIAACIALPDVMSAA